MTSHERVLAAINHQGPDRVPVDLGATPSSGISAINMAPEFLKKEFGKDCAFWGGGIETVGHLITGLFSRYMIG